MKKPVLFFSIVLLSSSSFAQQTKYLDDPQASFKQAKDFFQNEYYSLAYPIFRELKYSLRETDRSNVAVEYQDVKYYYLVCALEQNDKTAVDPAMEFIDVENNAPRVGMMSFHLAEYYFRQKDYTAAVRLYEQADIENLSNREIADLKFHQGYGYFTQQRFDKALPLFDAIRQLPKDPNYIDANYYYGFICFYQKKYSEALTAFKVVEDNPRYEKIVPYYVANIYLVQGQKDKAIDYAEARLKKGNQFYDAEMRQLVGHGYYEKQDFAKALPYLEQYVNQSKKVSRTDLYELSYCYYQTKSWDKAIAGFKQLGGKEDSLAQNSMYMLGDAYLKTGQKANARNAFLFCSSNSSNPQQKEISQYNYAKLSYELGYQDVALTELQAFLQRYPNSTYNREAKELLVSVLANTNNYKDAMTFLDSLDHPSENARRLVPRILYGRATEMVNDGMLLGAGELIDKALKDPYNASVLPYINFWKAEISYRLNKIDDAIRYYLEYLKTGGTNGEVSPVNARYNLGYCFLKKENYRQAQGFFEQVVRTPQLNSSPLEQDAYIRDADCFYMNRDFKTALSMYNKVLELSWPASDYATFQKAMIAGVSNGKEKINLLNSINRKYPASNLAADANMEIAGTYLAGEQYREALPYLKNVLRAPGADALKPRAYLQSGIAWYNLNNNKEALNQYDSLLKSFPNSPEAQDALDNAKSIYVEEGRSGEYVNFAKSMGVEVTASQEDQLAYEEAEVQFNNGNFAGASQKFEAYLSKFPDGKYSLEANYYKSEIYYSQKDWAKAVTGYQAVADRAPNKFGEKSLLQAARLNFFELKNYGQAEKYFIRLKDFASGQENKMEAMRGLLRSQYQLEKWPDAVANAKDLLAQKGVSTDDKVLANMAIAKSYQVNNQCETALQYFRTAAALSKSAYAAEARYQIADCLFHQNQLKDAEKAAFEVVNKSGSYEEWVTKAYLLLGDIYFSEKDYFNAKATFQSIVDNAKIEDLRKQAQQKLIQVTDEEKKNSKIGDQ
ncbi:tetratricopeptide repeat protein [Flavitalea sp. BT771]|uniref:tetratricopeptide repeat protein n=1 Tax=Flavitalea sp. BT771 TaxID=3063329 RepID=UPI0026E15E40|nr:tetratricopeptide repeat protein [Flavitalea sp. BT771]MDO6432292.1 tetratricopeptide repeat protein [Flavitalea sp. BT771]MDV6221202.1 tetratricopeptide repeat protein [Flavitalea sp. BT771]